MKRKLSITLLSYILRLTIPYYLITLTLLTSIIFIQQITRQAEIFSSGIPLNLVYLILIHTLPTITFITIPFSAIISTLVTINRLASDQETTAIQSSGLGLKQIFIPFIILGTLLTSLTFYFGQYITPRSIKTLRTLKAESIKTATELRIKPKTLTPLFNRLLFVHSINNKTGQWEGIFFISKSDIPGETLVSSAEKGSIEIIDNETASVGIQLSNGVSIVTAPDSLKPQEITSFKNLHSRLSDSSQSPIPEEAKRKYQEMEFADLNHIFRTRERNSESIFIDIEWHRRLALSFSALALILMAVPVGLKFSMFAGKTSTVIIGTIIAIIYYFISIAGQNLALTGYLPPPAGVWLANISVLFLAIATALTTKTNRSGFSPKENSKHGKQKTSPELTFPRTTSQKTQPEHPPRWSIPGTTNLMIIRESARFTVISVLTLITLTIVFTLFDLLPAISRNNIPSSYTLTYLGYLTPQMLYYTVPFSLLVGILITFGILTRSNQTVALLASGISPYQITTAVLLFCVTICGIILYMSETILPATNIQQDLRYNSIKGRRADQTVTMFGSRWTYGSQNLIYSFDHIDSANHLFNATVYKFLPESYHLCEISHADKATPVSGTNWQSTEGSWQETICPPGSPPASHSEQPVIFTAIEGPSLFTKPVNAPSKLSRSDLAHQITLMSRSGIYIHDLAVEFHKKLVFPFFGLIMVLLAIPFCFSMSNRNLLTKAAYAILLSLTFWTVSSIIENIGKQGTISAGLAAWSTPIIYLFLSLYLFFRISR